MAHVWHANDPRFNSQHLQLKKGPRVEGHVKERKVLMWKGHVRRCWRNMPISAECIDPIRNYDLLAVLPSYVSRSPCPSTTNLFHWMTPSSSIKTFLHILKML